MSYSYMVAGGVSTARSAVYELWHDGDDVVETQPYRRTSL